MEEVVVFGVKYNNITFREAVNTIDVFLSRPSQKMIFFLNTDYLYKALHDAEYAEILNSADLVLPDGIGLRLTSFLMGKRMKDDCNGTDLTPEILKLLPLRGYKVYFLGGRDRTIQKAKENAKKFLPEIKVVGAHSGYFSDDMAIIDKINNSQADVLLVGMGSPLQEKWVYKYRNMLIPRLCIGVGGWFGYWGGTIKRSPFWMRKIHCEWIWRIYLSPSQMISRYLRSGLYLTWLVIKSKFRAYEG